jgi:ribosome-associated protein
MDSSEQRTEQPPSKTQRKRDALALQKLGKQLTAVSPEKLQQLPITNEVITAIHEYNRLPNSHGAKKRQLQFIGRLMRDCDFTAITSALSELPATRKISNKEIEPGITWCEKILSDGDQQINEIVHRYPGLERQKLRQLYRDFGRATDPQREKLRQKLENYLQLTISD